MEGYNSYRKSRNLKEHGHFWFQLPLRRIFTLDKKTPGKRIVHSSFIINYSNKTGNHCSCPFIVERGSLPLDSDFTSSISIK